jgi:hypothetical protein
MQHPFYLASKDALLQPCPFYISPVLIIDDGK